jgi:predicted nucleotidyltransferase
MQRRSVEVVADTLNRRGVRYLVVGGLAVMAHGYVRTTQDLDIILDLDDPGNVAAALKAFRELEYRSVLPVPLEEFGDPAKRQEWARTRNAMVFRLSSPEHPSTPLDLFIELPFPFAPAYARAKSETLGQSGVKATFVSLEDLIAMKRTAGRPQDLADIAQLTRMQERLQEEEAERPPGIKKLLDSLPGDRGRSR